MAGQKILVIEDEKDIAELVRYNLSREGYKVSNAYSGEEGLRTAATLLPDLILLDLMLPEIDGLQVCRTLKSDIRTQHIPVIMVTAKREELDVVTGLELGADDYITKPFSPRVLIARVRVALRRKDETNTGDSEITPIRIHNLLIDPGRHQVLVDDTSVSLTHTEFRLLHTLADRPGWVFSRDQLVNSVRGEDAFVTDRTIDVHVAGLRKKLGESGNLIETVRGAGYRLKE